MMVTVIVLENVGAKRSQEQRVVDLDRDIVASFLADMFPACADFAGLVVRSGDHTVVRRCVAVAFNDLDESKIDVERQRVQMSGIAAIAFDKISDTHWSVSFEGGR